MNLPELDFRTNILKMSTQRYPGLIFHTTFKCQATSRDHHQEYIKYICKNAKNPYTGDGFGLKTR